MGIAAGTGAVRRRRVPPRVVLGRSEERRRSGVRFSVLGSSARVRFGEAEGQQDEVPVVRTGSGRMEQHQVGLSRFRFGGIPVFFVASNMPWSIRMQFEIMFVLAAATGRTLVLPPGSPLYLLYKDKTKVHRGIQDFFHPFGDVVGTISTEDFFRIEVLENKHYPLPTDETNRTKLIATLQNCIWMAKSEISCFLLNEYLTEVADYVPQIHGEHQCLVMDDENWFREAGRVSADSRHPDLENRIRKFCDKRTPVYYDNRWHDAPLLHFHSHTMTTRLLLHFYAFVYFTNPKVGNYYKRLVRDRVRYSDEIFCAAGKIVKALVEESMARNFNGDGAEAGYYAMHIRRGDFQWANMRLSSQEWYNNTQYWLEPGAHHSLYIATDERNRTFFGERCL
ncbi:hypothetical protein ACHAWF_006349 [Thalassiosira exigua]